MRLKRFWSHFTPWAQKDGKSFKVKSEHLLIWIVDGMFYFQDLLLIPDLAEVIMILLHGDVTLLSNEEIDLGRRYFDDTIHWGFVKKNIRMPRIVHKKALAYVSMNIIHYRAYIHQAVFIHELVHVWQYHNFGSVYLFRSLMAQRQNPSYDYGGFDRLYQGMIKGEKLEDFNFEQQGQIFEDMCYYYEGRDREPMADAVYKYYQDQLQR